MVTTIPLYFSWTSGKFFTPVVCFLLFNVGDFGGRVMAGVVQKVSSKGYNHGKVSSVLVQDRNHFSEYMYWWSKTLMAFLFLFFQPGKTGYWLLIACIARIVFLPLFAFCNYQPRNTTSTVLFEEDYWPVIFNILFSLSNGYLGSLCMMYGPT